MVFSLESQAYLPILEIGIDLALMSLRATEKQQRLQFSQKN